MFYRYTKAGEQVPVDLDGLYHGEDLFLLGGSPKLRELPLDLLRSPGVVTLAMNNVPCFFPRPTLWVSADRPRCFSPHIYTSPEITKFTIISRRALEVPGTGGKLLRECPNLYFYGTREDFTYENFLDLNRDLVWWRSVFPIALQLAHRLGFRRVFLVGCSFDMSKLEGEQYAWETALSDGEAQYSLDSYARDVERLRRLLPTFDRKGFSVVSCTPESKANAFLPYLPLAEAVEQVLVDKPKPADTSQLIHSSKLETPKAEPESTAATLAVEPVEPTDPSLPMGSMSGGELECTLLAEAETSTGYRRTYGFRGPPGATLIQEVRTEIRFGRPEAPLVSYAGYYAEYFRLDRDGSALNDIHEFDLRRDGWTLAVLRDLLKRAGARGPDGRRVTLRHSPRLTTTKRFLLGLGRVCDPTSQIASDLGADFGVLASGPGGEGWSRISVTPPAGKPWSRTPSPAAGVHAGRGWFEANTGWQAEETFRYEFATLSASVEATPYEPTPLAVLTASAGVTR